MVSEISLDEEELASGLTSPSENEASEDVPGEVTSPQPQEIQATPQAPDDSIPLESSAEDVVLEECALEDPRLSKNYDLTPRRMVALFDYDPSSLSPNPDSEVR